MSFPDPPNQPQWGPPGPGGQYQPPPPGPGYAPPPGPPGAPGSPAPRRTNRLWMVPVAAGMGLVLMAGTVWAANSVAQNVFVGANPETVLPGSSIAFAKLDLQPNGAQLADYAQFVNKLPESMRSEIDPDADPAKEMVESYIESADLDGMTYEADFEPWLGQSFGMSVWMPGNEDAADSSGAATAIAIEAEDTDAAEQTLSELQSESSEMAFDVRDDFAVITPGAATLNDLESQLESNGTLDEQDTYNQDMDAIGADNVASAWMDLGQAASLSEESSGMGGDYGGMTTPGPTASLQEFDDVTGRLAMGLRIEAEYVELRGDTFGVSVDGVSMTDYEMPEPGLGLMGDLPDDTVMAVGGSGLDDMIGQAYEDNPEQLGDLDDMMSELGMTMPGGLTKLLGGHTALGITDIGGSLDQFFSGTSGAPSLQYRADGADSAAVQDLIDRIYEQSQSYTTPPGVSSEGPVTVATSGTTGTGRLGDDPVYKQTMANASSAHMGMYLDLRPVAESAEESAPEQWGGAGASVTFGSDSVSMLARWAPNGDA